jgi:aryl-alcohol dehydrogenase-like predicted oxidoreductase
MIPTKPSSSIHALACLLSTVVLSSQWNALPMVDAFAVWSSSANTANVWLTTTKITTITSLASSSLDDNENNELAKLIEKRNQIKRKKKEDLNKKEDDIYQQTMVQLGMGVGDDATAGASNIDLSKSPGNDDDGDDGLSMIDWDNMPTFQTPRPVRQSKMTDSQQEKENSSSFRSDSTTREPTYVDFLADYDDENEFHIPNRLGVTTQCWGDESKGFVAKGKLKKQQLREGKFVPGDLQLAYNRLLGEGIVLVETSPDYGKAMVNQKLSAQDILARCIQEYSESVDTTATVSPLLIDTFANKLWQRSANAVASSLTTSCERLGVSAVDVYQVKNIGWLPSGGIIKGMTEAVIDQGTANYVGVQSISPLRLRLLINKLEKRGLTVTTNTFEFSLTQRKNEKWIRACKALGVIPLIRNPVGSGLASGQYTATNPSGGLASTGSAKFSFALLEKLQPLHSVLESVAERVKTRLLREVRDVQERYRGRKGPPVSDNKFLLWKRTIENIFMRHAYIEWLNHYTILLLTLSLLSFSSCFASPRSTQTLVQRK